MCCYRNLNFLLYDNMVRYTIIDSQGPALILTNNKNEGDVVCLQKTTTGLVEVVILSLSRFHMY